MVLKYTGTFVFNKELKTTVINIRNTPRTTEQMIACAYERVKCLCISELNDDLSLEV
jgi:hypothetical protein